MRKFSDILNFIARKHSLGNTFSDFLELAVCALSMQQKEDRYLEVISRYDKDEALGFSEAFASMIIEMGDFNIGWNDPLGAYFEEFITRGHNGQFFTPIPITDMLARVTIQEQTFEQRILDPACGSGRTLLSTAQFAGFSNRFYGADVDKNCAMMSVINMCLHGLKGEIAWMNSLSNEYYGGWIITRFPIPHLIEITAEQSEIVLKLPETLKQVKPKEIIFPTRIPDKGNPTQLILFE